ncbi:MAG: hypothetical protein HY738_02370 [Bacteroidia bacterium]|nr:hypothetical protein [Bacteroidia bacterium]
MELSINVNDKKVYETLVQFLNAMGITVSGKHNFENKTSNPKYKYPLSGTVMR